MHRPPLWVCSNDPNRHLSTPSLPTSPPNLSFSLSTRLRGTAILPPARLATVGPLMPIAPHTGLIGTTLVDVATESSRNRVVLALARYGPAKILSQQTEAATTMIRLAASSMCSRLSVTRNLFRIVSKSGTAPTTCSSG